MASNHNPFDSSLGNQALAPIKSHDMVTTNHASLLNSESAFPILTIAVLSIMGTTAFLLLSYYVFVVSKCCNNNNLHLINLLRRFFVSRATHINEEPLFIALSSPTTTMWNRRGLDDSIIRDIPTFQFFRGEGGGGEEEMMRNIYGCCVVCLNEFQEHDVLRVLPNCSHGFHLDCVDIWLQSNANCPLCRTSVSSSGTTTRRHPVDRIIIAPRSSPQGSHHHHHHQYSESLMGGGDEDFVVIELGGGEDDEVLFSHGQQQEERRDNSNNEAFEQPRNNFRSLKKRQHVSIMGDECIDVREKDDQFSIQPIRRSFSLDSAADRQLYITIRAIRSTKMAITTEKLVVPNEECSSRVRRLFFPFGQGSSRGSRNPVLPIEFEF